nr:protocadherin gamma a8 [Hymenolepis microstoma]
MRATLLDTTRGLASRLLHLSDMGDLYTINTIDRDDVVNICGPLECCSLPQCNLTFTSVFVDSENTDDPIQIDVSIQIIDSNDNAPTFQDEQFSITIPETTSLDLAKGQSAISEYSLPRASDKDSTQNGVKKYQLDEHSDIFSLTLPEHECYPCLKVSSSVPLDYENVRHRKFSLKLIAIDGGAVPKFGSIAINIFLSDLNDNAPVFAQPTEVIRVMENHTYNQAIYTVRATDADSGANGRVQYKFKTQHSTEIYENFLLNSVTGELFMHSELDYEKYSERKINLDILAYDDGRPSMTSSFALTIVVIDMNDNSPQIMVQQNHTVMENSKSNFPALQLLVIDVDEVSQGKIECYLENEERLPLRLEGQTFLTIWTTQRLDYEKTPFIDFILICQDKADPPMNTSYPLYIKVGNQNDNPPVFYSPQKTPTNFINLTMSEDEKLLHPLYLPSVIDCDGSQVLFNIKSREKDCPFSVNSDTGAVYLKTPLDYERSKRHEFEIVAVDIPETDSKDPALTSSVKVRVKVQDVNDNAPELKSPHIIPVKHDTPIGYMVSQLIFKDADMDGQQKVSAKLVTQETYPTLTARKYFALKENGALITLCPLYKDELSVIALTVVTNDIGSEKTLSSTFTLAIVIENSKSSDTLKVIRPFPKSTVVLPINKSPGRPLKSENVRGISIPLEVYDSTKSKTLTHAIERRCNGSEYFMIDKNETLSIKPIINDATLVKLSSVPSGSKVEVIIKVTDSGSPTRVTDSTFYIEFNWVSRMSGHALWPADAADAGSEGESDGQRVSDWIDIKNQETEDGQSNGKPIKLSFGNIVMFLLILVFSLAVGFALFAAILWARAKRATSNAAATAGRRRSFVVPPSNPIDKARLPSPKRSSIWRPGSPNSTLTSECIQLTSSRSEQPPEVHYAILTATGNTVLGEFSKASEPPGTTSGPVLAYFDLIVPPTNEDPSSSTSTVQQNFPELATVVSVSSPHPDIPTSQSQSVNCYLVM